MPHVEAHVQKTCFSCVHWKKQDRAAVLWEIEPPDEYECEIWQIERQWIDPQAVIDAAYRGPKKKAEAIAKQCPNFYPVNISQQVQK